MDTTFRELFKLYDLIQNGDARSVERFLTDNTIDVNVILPCKSIGVLHLAVGVEPPDKSKECTELLMKYGGDPNLCNDDGITPVHIAAIWGRVDNLKLLIGCGGDPSQRDMDGHSAFDYAVKEQQWDVYDYLHNVVDQKNDSVGSQCAYTLDLDKILVTTDQIVAVYEPAPEHEADAKSIRNSELVRDWCEKTCLMMNKLYPTILSDTYLIDNESVPWKSGEFSNNMTMDLTSNKLTNDTDISFKTCLSRKVAPTIEITGIQALETSLNDSQDNNCSCCCEKRSSQEPKKRVSVYENFSLPGSPNNITHRNYNSKSSLKRSKDPTPTDSLSSELKAKLTFNESQLTEDRSLDLDKAFAVAQNETNEWLSSGGECCTSGANVFNTRRSSASSGVSSNVSGGSIVLASMHEEYKYQDIEEDVVLLEKRLLLSSIVLPVDDSADLSPDQTILSIASSLPTSVDYDNNTLRAELLRLGFTPGPIRDNTRRLYLKKLKELKQRPVVVNNNQPKSYSRELEKSLRTDEWMKNLTPYIELESKVRADFANTDRKWREGSAKTSFTYLLLDARLTSNLPARATKQSQHASWVTFINSIFYVGKGKRSRPYSHLYQAVTLWKRDFTTSKDKKVQHILDIWSDKVGVVCLHIFQNVIPAEAYTNEAAMIDALGVANLKNLKSGNYYGAAGAWPLKERRMFGLYLLYKAMLIFLSEGERQLRPEDID